MLKKQYNRKDNYLDNLDAFLDDNLRTIAELIGIKKNLENDVKRINEAWEVMKKDLRSEEKKKGVLEAQVRNEMEQQIALEYQTHELQRVLLRMRRSKLDREAKLNEEIDLMRRQKIELKKTTDELVFR